MKPMTSFTMRQNRRRRNEWRKKGTKKREMVAFTRLLHKRFQQTRSTRHGSPFIKI